MFFLYFFMISCMVYPTILSETSPRIAIIGGGIAGTSCAYFLRELFEEKAELTLYEREAIGGRMDVLEVDEDFYESGAAVIRPTNRYMMDFTYLLGLNQRVPAPAPFGIYDGKDFVYKESDWNLATMAKFLWRYGISSLGLFKWVHSLLLDFDRIYTLQEKEYAYTTVSGMLDALNPSFHNMTQQSLATVLQNKSYSQLLLDEVVSSINMINYGLNNDIAGFAGIVSLSGANSKLWSVHKGNNQVPQGILAKSKATLKIGDVSEIKLMPDGTYALNYYDASSKQNLSTEYYDIIVIACPLIKDAKNIKFTNFQSDFSEFERTFHPLVTTLVQGELNSLTFNMDHIPKEILTYKSSLGFNSISKVTPARVFKNDSKKSVFRVFSEKPLSESFVEHLFQRVKAVKQKSWQAYPHYVNPKPLPPFMLHPRLFYINAIELATSEMEMSAIGGKNVALLAFNMWHDLKHKIDYREEVPKDEL